MLISTHPGFLSLAFIHSVSLKHTNINIDTDTHARALAHAPHAHKPILHPKIHEGKSLSSSTSHSFPSTLRGTVPSSVPALPLKSPCISGKQLPVTAHSASFLFAGLVTVRWRLFFVSSFEIICVNWENPWGRLPLFFFPISQYKESLNKWAPCGGNHQRSVDKRSQQII